MVHGRREHAVFYCAGSMSVYGVEGGAATASDVCRARETGRSTIFPMVRGYFMA